MSFSLQWFLKAGAIPLLHLILCSFHLLGFGKEGGAKEAWSL